MFPNYDLFIVYKQGIFEHPNLNFHNFLMHRPTFHPLRAWPALAALLFMLHSNSSFAQWATVASGGNDTIGALVISSSIGEWDVQTLTYSGGSIQNGVQQPYQAYPWHQSRILGSLRYNRTAFTPLAGTQIQLRRGAQLMATATTDAGGQFDLGVVDTGFYQIEYSNAPAWRGVNSTDALEVLRYFGGSISLTGLNLLAGDVNARGLVNAMEAQTIARRTIRLVNQFAAGDWLYSQQEVSVLPSASPMQLTLQALCYGDVNASYNPGPLARMRWDVVEPMGAVQADADKSGAYELPLYWLEGGSVGAITLELQVPAGIQVEEVLKGTGHIGGALHFHQQGDVLRIAWYGIDPWQVDAGGELLRLRMRGSADEAWRVGQLSELADAHAQPIGSFRLGMPGLGEGALEAMVLPNPVRDRGQLMGTVPGAGTLEWEVSDAFGRRIWTERAQVGAAGRFSYALPMEAWASGTYVVRVHWQGEGKSEVKVIRVVKGG